MSTVRQILVIAALTPTLVFGAAPDGTLPSSDTRAELTALVTAWIDAEVHDDRDVLEQIFHEDFLSTFASGATMGRTEYIDFIVSLDISPFTVTNEAMRVFGNTAVVIDVSDDGKTKFTWIAVKLGDQWQVISQTFSTVN